jgi:hypothetical protein
MAHIPRQTDYACMVLMRRCHGRGRVASRFIVRPNASSASTMPTIRTEHDIAAFMAGGVRPVATRDRTGARNRQRHGDLLALP